MKIRFDNPVFEYLNTAAQFIGLNLLFLLCCLPIVTIGPAIAALYQVMLRESRGEHGYLFRKFFQHFKEMFLQACLTFFFFAAVLFLLLYTMVFWFNLSGAGAAAAFVLTLLLFLCVLAAFFYVFPLMARFQNTFRATIRNAFLLSFTNIKITAILFAVYATLAAMFYLFPTPSKVIMILIGFSFLAYGTSFLFSKLFKNCV